MGRPARAADLKVKQEWLVAARSGIGFRMAAGEYVQILDVTGAQCADFFAFDAGDPREYLSASHTRVGVDRLFRRWASRSSRACGGRCSSSRRTTRPASTTCSSRRATPLATASTA